MWFLLLACFFLLLLYYTFKHLKYWQSKGIPGPTPLPLVGNIGPGIVGIKTVSEVLQDIYLKYEDCPFVGIYRMTKPCILLRDPELVKNVLIKDFQYFLNNDVNIDKKVDPLLARNPFVLKGEEWKKTRQAATPNFATGKIKSVFPLAVNVTKDMVEYLEKQKSAAVNAKDMFIMYNCDVVAVCGFGSDGNSFKDPNAQFVNLARTFLTPGSLQAVKLGVSLLLPNLVTVKLAPKAFDDGVISLTEQTLKYRQENNVNRNDIFDIISKIPSASVIDKAAHIANLIIDGFETSSTSMTFIIYELASNQACQKELRKEINTVLEKNQGELSYESVQDMVYLDACIKETMRMHPPVGHLSKMCTETYTLTSTGNEYKNMSVTLDKGTPVIIPILGLHMDPKLFPSPEKYMPERFLDKSEAAKYVFMPFGNGPRMCLGNRFAMMQLKVGITELVRNFEVTLNEKTRQPIKYVPFHFLLYPKGGVWINCKKIDL
ncbi:hypothetical protein NQ315_007702 [Exocentrus adspersus]|uniref:Cytochrome P450 n=1 Tax=Exocentrus adspersus TaxID=1586481 RepID=A0AAV8W9E5_9CUCU|nr:hypothetical protein NQ315_007702 [Exocentrus adspersus]